MNRQRYMAELSKLLAFMFKEDKEDILAQYNRMLDETEDEQAMLESFGSPTKLAVTISRTYKRSERKLAVEADSKDGAPADEALPTAPAPAKTVKPEPAADASLSYADIIEEIRREKAAEDGIEYKPIFFDEPEEAPASEETPASSPEPEEVLPEPEEALEPESGEQTQELEHPEQIQEPEQQPESEETKEPEEEVSSQPAESPADETPDEEPEEAPAEEPEAPADESEEVLPEPEEALEPENEVRYKTNVALLILYLIVAIPVGIVLVAVTIAVGIALLAVGAGLVAAALKIVSFAFSMFNIFADIMLCAGASLIALAVALIVIWLGILVFARAIGGIVRGIRSVGRSFCVKEVSVDE